MPPVSLPIPPPGQGSDVGGFSVWLALLMAGLMLIFLIAILRHGLQTGQITKRQLPLYAFAVVGAVVSFFGIAAVDAPAKVFHFITTAVGLHATQVLVAVVVITAGFGAHRFKQASKLLYGYHEILFGVLSSVLVVSRINFAAIEFRNLSLAQYGTLVGAAYVVGRGFNNVSEAKQEKLRATSNAAPIGRDASVYQRSPEQTPA